MSAPTIQGVGGYSLPLTLEVPWSRSFQRRRDEMWAQSCLPSVPLPRDNYRPSTAENLSSSGPVCLRDHTCTVSTPSTFWDVSVGPSAWAAPGQDPSDPIPNPVCLFLWGWTGAEHRAAAEHTASAEEPERTSVGLAASPRGMLPAQEQARNIPSHPMWRGVDHRHPQLMGSLMG